MVNSSYVITSVPLVVYRGRKIITVETNEEVEEDLNKSRPYVLKVPLGFM